MRSMPQSPSPRLKVVLIPAPSTLPLLNEKKKRRAMSHCMRSTSKAAAQRGRSDVYSAAGRQAEINESVLKDGFPLPDIPHVRFVDPDLSFQQYAVRLAANVQYVP
jgi:hypothetical protein